MPYGEIITVALSIVAVGTTIPDRLGTDPKFSLDDFQLRDHPLLSRDSPGGECSGGELPTEIGET